MKIFQYLTILLFALASLLVELNGYGQVEGNPMPRYIPQNKYDTVQIRMLYDAGGNVPIQVNGYVVRQWHYYYRGIDAGGCMGCRYPADKWIDTDEILTSKKYSTVIKENVWQYKYCNW